MSSPPSSFICESRGTWSRRRGRTDRPQDRSRSPQSDCKKHITENKTMRTINELRIDVSKVKNLLDETEEQRDARLWATRGKFPPNREYPKFDEPGKEVAIIQTALLHEPAKIKDEREKIHNYLYLEKNNPKGR